MQSPGIRRIETPDDGQCRGPEHTQALQGGRVGNQARIVVQPMPAVVVTDYLGQQQIGCGNSPRELEKRMFEPEYPGCADTIGLRRSSNKCKTAAPFGSCRVAVYP